MVALGTKVKGGGTAYKNLSPLHPSCRSLSCPLGQGTGTGGLRLEVGIENAHGKFSILTSSWRPLDALPPCRMERGRVGGKKGRKEGFKSLWRGVNK